MSKADELINKLNTLEIYEENAQVLYDTSSELFKEASKKTDHHGMMVSDYFFAYYYIYCAQNYEKAIQYVSSCLNEAKTLASDEYFMKGHFLKGVSEMASMDVYSAIESLLVCLKHARLRNDLNFIIFAHNAIGDAFYIIHDKKTALKYYEEAKNDVLKADSPVPNDKRCQKILFDYVLTNISLNNYDVVDRTINYGMREFNELLKTPFIAFKEIVSTVKMMDYSKIDLTDAMYKILLKIDNITDIHQKIRILLIIKGLIKKANNIELSYEYCDLLDSYTNECPELAFRTNTHMIKANLLNENTEDSNLLEYAENVTAENVLVLNSLNKSIKKILELNNVESERDIEIEKNKKLEELSSTDELTKLYNRRSSESLIKGTLADVTKASYAFIIIDVDKFKDINDTYGHTTGDKALVYLSNTLSTLFDKDAIVSRLGGDEFVLMLYNLPTQYDIRKNLVTYKLDQLMEKLASDKLDFLDNSSMSISLGISLDDGDFDTLYSNADVALYNSKYSGRGTYSIYPDHSKVQEG